MLLPTEYADCTTLAIFAPERRRQTGEEKLDRRITAGIYTLTARRGSRVRPAESLTAIDRVRESRREIEILDADVRVHRLERNRGVWSGEFLRRQTENIPPKAFARGGVASLGLGRDEGLGHGAAFVFHPANNILIWENVRTGASLSRFSAYLEHFADGSSYEVNPSLTREAMIKLRHAHVKRLRIRIADPADLRTFDNTQRSIKDAMRLLERLTNGAFVEIEVGAERGANSFLGGAARDTMRWLLNESVEQRGGIQKLQIDGRT